MDDQTAITRIKRGDLSGLEALAWNSDKFWFGISYMPAYNTGKEATREMLVEIAESMK